MSGFVRVVRLVGAASLGLVLSLSLTGCFTDPDIDEVVDAVSWELEPARLDTEVELRFGGGTLGLARMLCGFVDDCEEYQDIIAGIDEVHLGVYNVEGSSYDSRLRLSDELREDLEYDGWQVVMTSYDEDESVFVMAQVDEDNLNGMYVVAYEGDELVVIRLEGELEESLHAAVRRDGSFMTAMHSVADEDWDSDW
jgi:hypothetical protein